MRSRLIAAILLALSIAFLVLHRLSVRPSAPHSGARDSQQAIPASPVGDGLEKPVSLEPDVRIALATIGVEDGCGAPVDCFVTHAKWMASGRPPERALQGSVLVEVDPRDPFDTGGWAVQDASHEWLPLKAVAALPGNSVRITIDSPTIAGTVVFKGNGAPVVGGVVYAWKRGARPELRELATSKDVRVATTDDRGSFMLCDVDLNTTYDLVAGGHGFASAKVHEGIAPGTGDL